MVGLHTVGAGGPSSIPVWRTRSGMLQIRVHMAFTGHPLLGDTTYGGRKFGNSEHFLHSHKLTIKHPTTGKTMTFQAEIPQRFQEVIEELRTGGQKNNE